MVEFGPVAGGRHAESTIGTTREPKGPKFMHIKHSSLPDIGT